LLLRRFSEWEFTRPRVDIELLNGPTGPIARFTSQAWVWNLLLDPSGAGGMADDCFDLFPNAPYDIPLKEGQGAPHIQFSGNHLVAG
jgi:hypothetical protein